MKRIHAARVSALVLLALAAPVAHAEPVDGPWTLLSTSNGPLIDANTDHPTVGDNTTNSAAGEMFHSPFTEVILADGDKLVFTGSVTLAGIGTVTDSSGFPRTQFRMGLFDSDIIETGWVGYLMTNSSGTGTPNGSISRKPVGNGSTYLSTTGANSLSVTGGTQPLFDDDVYNLKLSVQRTGADIIVNGEIVGTDFSQIMTGTDATAGVSGTYTFNALGFLLGNNLGVNQAVFANLKVELNPTAEDADFDNDADVDGADFLIWQQGLGVGTTNAQGDANGDSVVNAADLAVWSGAFGPPAVPAVGAVPEPAALSLVAIALTAAALARRRPRSPSLEGRG